MRDWLDQCPVLADIIATRPVFWLNPERKSCSEAQAFIDFDHTDQQDAADRLDRFRPYFARTFPETAPAGGLIESPLRHIPAMHAAIEDYYGIEIPGRMLVKLDSHLPISGSIKARGGIYAIAKFAEATAIASGLLKITDNYALLASARCHDLFHRYSIIVGSTGNLGLSIGIIGAELGFRVIVHMSADAKHWKKEMLRARGVSIVEHDADYSIAVAKGREQAKADPFSYFVDDENSRDLFLGYAVAAKRLQAQFDEHSIQVDADHPLLVYLPCGVGGGPGGVSFGLKLAFGDNVHCFFGEPTQSPAMLVGLATGLDHEISALQLGIKNKTIADGLAVSRPSQLVCRVMRHMLSGIFTAEDREMYRLLALLADSEDIRLEPSGVIGFAGFARLTKAWEELHLTPARQQQATHLIWATGGSMVPDSVWQQDFRQGRHLLANGDASTEFR
ncbi:D-serine ammonia-lyase [Desulfopila sp. IMCC35006]|uniref:D-serine ammonia-lyase n=1 Tax=Desulfopila sp. IMCC35006 TaxID=2569542 RepID=UPI0010AB80EE|nr:D-serine ammonia-lyase [Desulfopila sp. IMCC35006]